MKYIISSIAFILVVSSCKKDSCQTNLSGLWHSVKNPSAKSIVIDAVQFFKGDSLLENYRAIRGTDTIITIGYGSFFITDDCSEMTFHSTTHWGNSDTIGKYDVLSLTASTLSFRAKSQNNCDSCMVILAK